MTGFQARTALKPLRPNSTQIFPRPRRFPPAMLLGAHVSIAGGFATAPIAGKKIGCEAIQIFSRSPRMIRRTKPIPAEDVQAFWDGMKKAGIGGVATHGNYLINLSATSRRMLGVARTTLIEEIEPAQVLGMPSVIFHPSTHMS